MMRSVAVRLTLIYLAIIMTLSIGFSLVIYRISTDELKRGTRSPGFVVMMDDPIRHKLEAAREIQLDTGQHNLQRNLILLNMGTLVLGALVSYGLARRTLQPIEEAFEAQGRFTADASHELRTPLTAMQTSIEVGLRNPKLKLAESKELLASMLDEVKKLSSLSNGLLKLTRNTSDAMPQKEVSLAGVAHEAVSQLELAAKHKDITIKDEIESLNVRGDDISIKEAIVILLDNAIKYTTEGTTIRLTSKQQGKFAHLTITDQGPGIKATDLVHIFERFYRADSSRSRDRVEGYGLGLSIAQKIAQAHGGSVEVVSQLGEGSAFTFKLPLFERP